MSEKPIALVSTPWPLYSRPSIQLACLKSFLRQAHPGLSVDAYHFYLTAAAALGYRVYHDISQRTWSAESVYAALLAPERSADIGKLFARSVKASSELHGLDFTRIVERISAVSERFIDSVDWERYGLVGFSVCLCQLTAALYFIRRIKTKAPSVPVVVGGSSLAGETIAKLLETYPQIDFAVYGEGELPLSRLVAQVKDASDPAAVGSVAGVVSRHSLPAADLPDRSQLDDLTALPTPDFSDYFQSLESLSPANRFFPTLCVEMSRGCWWHKPAAGFPGSGCAFCNLNQQWQGYRTKRPEQVVREIEALTQKHQTLSVAFMDNLIPLNAAGTVFDRLAASGKDYRLFCEIRGGTSRSLLEKMKGAGVVELQIGIEALSTRLLTRLNKGTTAMDNLLIMKRCEALGLKNASNLILGFPGSDQRDVDETLQNLSFATVFRPLRAVDFWLGLGSPVWRHPKSFGVRAVYNHPNWSVLLPADAAGRIPLMIQAYRSDRTIQKKRWKPVRDKLAEWKRSYEALHSRPQALPILSYRDGSEFLIIRQRRLAKDPMNHRLVGASRKIYLFCDRPRALAEIRAAFPSFGANQLRSFLAAMVDKRLMFAENGQYLSLAVPARADGIRSVPE